MESPVDAPPSIIKLLPTLVADPNEYVFKWSEGLFKVKIIKLQDETYVVVFLRQRPEGQDTYEVTTQIGPVSSPEIEKKWHEVWLNPVPYLRFR